MTKRDAFVEHETLAFPAALGLRYTFQIFQDAALEVIDLGKAAREQIGGSLLATDAAGTEHHDRLLFLHIKDVESLATNDERGRAYRWVELGRGRVDLPAVFAALKDVKFRGWAVIELDSVPDKSKTPRECALISKKYVEEKLRMKI